MEMRPVAHIHTDFPTKFGIPRQGGLIEELKGTIVFEPYYRDPEGVKGLAEFSHIWVLWDFSEAHRAEWSSTARPPRLGGKTRKGIWATRSPFRPNNIGLSCVKLEKIELSEDRGPMLYVAGIDMMDGTPVYDIKPYTRYDCFPDAVDGYVSETAATEHRLEVCDPDGIIASLDGLSEQQKAALWKVLESDPRPQYDADDTGVRRYGFFFGDYDVRFRVRGNVLELAETVRVRSR